MTTIITFVPALHAGYIKFFKKYPDTLYLLDADFVADFPRLERDIRQLDTQDMKKAIEALEIFKKVEILHVADAVAFKDRKALNEGQIIMPDEDITRELAEKYFKEVPVVFEQTFLRWDKQISQAELVIAPDRTISTEELDKEFVQKALDQAVKSSDWWRQVGAVAVRDGKILFTGYNRHMPTDLSMDVYGDPRSSFDAGVRFDLSTAIHGEASLIAKAAKEGISLDQSCIYVSTFPCPGCAKLIVDAGIKKVYYLKGYSLLDAENILKSAEIEIVMVKLD